MVAVRVVTELSEHPGAEDVTKSGKAAVGLSVRVLIKMVDQLGLEGGDLCVEHTDHGHQRGRRRPRRRGDRARCIELWRAQGLSYLSRPALEVALPAAPPQRRDHLGLRQPPALCRGGPGGEHRQRVAISEIGAEAGDRARVVLAQRAPEPVDLRLAVLDQALVGPGDHLDRLDLVAVTRDRAEQVAISADQIREHASVAGVGLGASDAVTVAITRRDHRVHRVHLVAGSDQRRDQQAAIGLDPHSDGFVRVDLVLSDQRVKTSDPSEIITDPRAR